MRARKTNRERERERGTHTHTHTLTHGIEHKSPEARGQLASAEDVLDAELHRPLLSLRPLLLLLPLTLLLLLLLFHRGHVSTRDDLFFLFIRQLLLLGSSGGSSNGRFGFVLDFFWLLSHIFRYLWTYNISIVNFTAIPAVHSIIILIIVRGSGSGSGSSSGV
jgi:hypothetical protein